MEFLSTLPPVQSKNLYPCLASITIAPPGNTSDRSRRLSTGSAEGSAVADDGDDNLIKRVISGGRRKSSFGTTANGAGATAQGGGEGGGAANRRMSIAPSAMGHGGVTMGSNATGPEGVQQGTWFWRVQAGVVDNNLVLLPISSPANPLLTAPPAPLSSAMPAHHTSNKSASGSGFGSGHQHQGGEGIVDKVKDLFRRGSSTSSGKADAAHVDTDGNDRIIDQTPGGEQLPSASANAVGANNLNANAETGWPGIVDGEKLQAVVVPLNQLDKSKVKVSGGKRGEASWVTVPVTSHFAHMIQGHADGATAPKSGVIRLEFDKDWIGSKGEAELLHHHITQALSNRSPQPPQVQLGQTHHATHQSVQGQGSAFGRRTAGDQVIDDHDQGHTLSQALGYTPDESVASSRKVAG